MERIEAITELTRNSTFLMVDIPSILFGDDDRVSDGIKEKIKSLHKATECLKNDDDVVMRKYKIDNETTRIELEPAKQYMGLLCLYCGHIRETTLVDKKSHCGAGIELGAVITECPDFKRL